MTVTSPLCNDDFWMIATTHMHVHASAMLRKMYLLLVSAASTTTGAWKKKTYNR